jgi:hypothetical protein
VLLLEAWAASYGAAYAGADHRPPSLALGLLTPDDDFLDDAPESSRDLFDEAPDEHGDEGVVDGSTTTSATRHVTGDALGANREPGAFPPTPLLASLSGHGAPDALGNAHDIADVSHFGLPRPGLPGDVAFRFVRLPESFTAVWKSTSELGRRGQTSELSISVKSTSIRLIFGRIDCSRRVLEA